ncbi:transcriptional regulator, AbrB family [Thermoplasmatales archaeon]|nr:transcriptional regulator, AbrB family [Thermoplasmatales archaeon]
MDKKPIIDVTHVSARGTSYRITIPRKVAKRLGLNDGDILAFFDDDGVKIDKIQ